MNLPCPVPTLPAFAPCCCLSCTGQPTALQRTATAILDTGGKAWASARSRILEIDSRELFEEVERQELGRHRARTTLVVALRDRRMTLPQMQPGRGAMEALVQAASTKLPGEVRLVPRQLRITDHIAVEPALRDRLTADDEAKPPLNLADGPGPLPYSRPGQRLDVLWHTDGRNEPTHRFLIPDGDGGWTCEEEQMHFPAGWEVSEGERGMAWIDWTLHKSLDELGAQEADADVEQFLRDDLRIARSQLRLSQEREQRLDGGLRAIRDAARIPDGDPTVESIRGIASARDRLADLLESVETVTGVPWLEMDGTIRAKADWFDALLDAWAGFGPDNATTVADVAAALRTIRLLCREQG